MFNLSKFNPILKSWKTADYFIFLILLPSILLLTYLLPETIKNYLILRVSSPSLLSIFFSNYVHVDLLNFLGNFLSYFFIIFVLFNLETNKNLFYRSSFLIFIILPFVSSFLIINILPPTLPPSMGFSAIVAGFMGYLVYSAFRYIKMFYYMKVNYFFLYWIMIINLAAVAYNLHTPILFQIFILFISVILLYLNKTAINEIGKQIILRIKECLAQKLIGLLFYNYLVFVLSIVSMFALPTLIPSNITIGSSIINILSHYIGYLFGLFVPIITDKLKL